MNVSYQSDNVNGVRTYLEILGKVDDMSNEEIMVFCDEIVAIQSKRFKMDWKIMAFFVHIMRELMDDFLLNFRFAEKLMNVMCDPIVVHHNHYSGKIYGYAHKRCNSMVQDPYALVINVYAHNAKFDNKFVLNAIDLSQLTSDYKRCPEVEIFGENSEQIKEIMVAGLHFKDSFAVFESGLDDLTKINGFKKHG